MINWKNVLDTEETQKRIKRDLDAITGLCHGLAVQAGWWSDLKTGESIKRNKGELLCLIHSEISEAMEGARKDLMDDHLLHRKMEEVELADAVIRIFDYAGAYDLDIGSVLVEKLVYNTHRQDHKIKNRKADKGKKF